MPRPLNFRNSFQRKMPRARQRKQKKAKKLDEFWTLDCETDPFHSCSDPQCSKCDPEAGGRVPNDFIWGAYSGTGDQYVECSSADEICNHFRDYKTVVYAHNGGKFDYHYLRDHINSDEPLMVINGRLSKFKIGACEFRDSLNIFPNTRLKDFGIKDEIDYELMESEARKDPNVLAEIKKYLKQDCVGLWDMVARYRKEYGKKLTQAGASMKYWEKNYFKDEAPRQTRRQHDLYKKYYNGGRVQCFSSGVGTVDFKVADINSAYPYAMLSGHPIETEGERRIRLPPDSVLPQTLITLVGTSRGALPWRDDSGELYFPDDEAGSRKRVRTYHVTGHEFIAALECDALRVNKIVECHVFWKRIHFKDYIDHFFDLREKARLNGDVAGRIFGKYFMNSLYGKFGANPDQYKEYVIATSDSIEAWKVKGYVEYKPWGNERTLMIRDLPDVQKRFYNVATAASVTGYVRAYLFRALHACHGPLYCDTDSIAARDCSGLAYGTELGKWKHEGSFDRYAIAGKKLYAFHQAGTDAPYDPELPEKDRSWKIAAKGIKITDSTQAPDIISALARGEEVKVLNQTPCYTITRPQPVFIHRTVKSTYKDVSLAPDEIAA